MDVRPGPVIFIVRKRYHGVESVITPRQLQDHRLDLVLSNIPVRADQEEDVFNHPLGEVPVFLVGGKKLKSVRPTTNT